MSVMLGELVGGAGCMGGQERERIVRFLDDLRAFGINADQTVEDCSAGRGGMAQDGGTGGGMFYSKIDRSRESQREDSKLACAGSLTLSD